MNERTNRLSISWEGNRLNGHNWAYYTGNVYGRPVMCDAGAVPGWWSSVGYGWVQVQSSDVFQQSRTAARRLRWVREGSTSINPAVTEPRNVRRPADGHENIRYDDTHTLGSDFRSNTPVQSCVCMCNCGGHILNRKILSLTIIHAGITAGVGRAFSHVCLYVSLRYNRKTAWAINTYGP